MVVEFEFMERLLYNETTSNNEQQQDLRYTLPIAYESQWGGMEYQICIRSPPGVTYVVSFVVPGDTEEVGGTSSKK